MLRMRPAYMLMRSDIVLKCVLCSGWLCVTSRLTFLLLFFFPFLGGGHWGNVFFPALLNEEPGISIQRIQSGKHAKIKSIQSFIFPATFPSLQVSIKPVLLARCILNVVLPVLPRVTTTTVQWSAHSSVCQVASVHEAWLNIRGGVWIHHSAPLHQVCNVRLLEDCYTSYHFVPQTAWRCDS